MSTFAAGCAICGADLEAPPRRRAPRPLAALRVPSPSGTAVMGAVLALLLLGFPLLCLLLAGWIAHSRDRAGDLRERNLALVFVALSAGFLIAPALQLGLWSLLA